MSAEPQAERRDEPGSRRLLAEMRELPSSRSLVLWFGVLGPPLAWASHLLLGDGMYELGCGPGFEHREIYGLPFEFWHYLQTALFLAVCIVAGVLSFRAYRRLRVARLDNPTILGRAKGMALAGVASAAIYGLLLIYGFLPPLFLTTCGRSI